MEFINLLEKYWTIIAAFIGIIISYTNLKAQNVEQEKRIIHLESKCESFGHAQTQIDIKLAEIQMDLRWIKQSLKNEQR